MDNTTKTSPKDVFMHLLAIITLYISAVSFGALLFQFINIWFPDPLVDYYRNFSEPIRWALASLVIVFPAYVLLSRTIQKDLVVNADKRELRIRKWLLYFTLFLAAAVIIGDLVALVYNFLGGDLSARFILKILVVFFIASAIFGYYIWNLRNARPALSDPRMRWFVWGIIALVAASVVYGFTTVGSPFAERLRRFDEQRIQNLQEIQWQVINYWQKKAKLPEKLEDLDDNISGFSAPRDPKSGSAYEYRVLGNLKFELCAIFETEEKTQPAIGTKPLGLEPGTQNWTHGAERTCFERTIDPELYKPFPDKPSPVR